MRPERLLQRLGLHDLGVVRGSGVERIDAGPLAFGVAMHDQLEAVFARHGVTECDHLAEFPPRVDMHQRKWDGTGQECLTRQMKHDRRVFSDRVQHDRRAALGDNLAHDVDRFCLES